MRMTFDFGVDLNALNISKPEITALKERGFKRLFEEFFTAGLGGKYGERMSGTVERAMNRLLDKLDAASGNVLELDATEFELLKDAFCNEQYSFEPRHQRLKRQYVRAISNAVDKDAPRAAVEEKAA